jgi:hypothetical protein
MQDAFFQRREAPRSRCCKPAPPKSYHSAGAFAPGSRCAGSQSQKRQSSFLREVRLFAAQQGLLLNTEPLLFQQEQLHAFQAASDCFCRRIRHRNQPAGCGGQTKGSALVPAVSTSSHPHFRIDIQRPFLRGYMVFCISHRNNGCSRRNQLAALGAPWLCGSDNPLKYWRC